MSNEDTPAIRNILYVSDMYDPAMDKKYELKHPGEAHHYSNLEEADILNIAEAPYTHVLVAFLHLDEDLGLHYNGILADEMDWEQFRKMQTGEHAKKILASYGGWIKGMPDWVHIRGDDPEKEDAHIAKAAEVVADLVSEQNLDGIDINFEGFQRHDESFLSVLGRFVVNLRLQLGDEKLITIAPIHDNLNQQVDAINDACAGTKYKSWQDIVSWVHCQFYLYPEVESNQDIKDKCETFIVPQPDPDASTGEKSALPIPADKLVVGLPLWGSAPSKNEEHLATYQSVIEQLIHDPKVQQHGGFGGVFVWRYSFTRYPENLDWAGKIVPVPIYQYEASKIEALRYSYSPFAHYGEPGQGGEGWTNDGIAFWTFGKEGSVGVYGYYSVYDSGCWRYEYFLHEEENEHWTQVGDKPLFYVFDSQAKGTQPVYRYSAPPTHDYKSKRYQLSLDPNIDREGWEKDPEPAFYAYSPDAISASGSMV